MNDLLVSHVMTAPVVTLNRADSLPGAGELMKQNRIRHLPVVDDEGHLIGLVTHRDILAARVGGTTGLSEDETSDLQLGVPVEKVMRRWVWTLRPSQPAVDAARLLYDLGFGCAPVVDGDKKVIGIVTEADFLELAAGLLGKEPDLEVSALMSSELVTLDPEDELQVADLLMRFERIRHLPVVEKDGRLAGLVTHRDLLAAQRSSLTSAPKYASGKDVRDVMRTDVDTVEPDVPAADAARAMAEHKYGCLPVTRGDKVVGIVTEADFMAAVVERLARVTKSPRHDAPVNYYTTEPAHVVSLDDDLVTADQLMMRYRVAGLAAVDDDGVLRAAISRTDLLRVCTAGTRRTRMGHASGLLSLPQQPVESVASRALHTVRPETPVVEAAATMLRAGVHRLFVVDDERRPTGVLSVTDLMLAVRDFRLDAPIGVYASTPIFTTDVSEEIGRITSLLELAGISGVIVRDGAWPVGVYGRDQALAARDLPADTPVEHAMSAELITVPSGMPVHRVAAQSAALRARRVVVMKEGQTTGVITGMDFARMLAAAR